MLTTDALAGRTPTVRALVVAAVAALVVGLVLAGAGGVAAGAPAAWGALVGAGLVVGVVAFGAFSVNVVAGVLPGASLLVAVVTYGAQIATTLVVLVRLDQGGVLDDGTISRGWLAAGVIAAALTWTAAQIVAVVRIRVPVYDLPEAGAR